MQCKLIGWFLYDRSISLKWVNPLTTNSPLIQKLVNWFADQIFGIRPIRLHPSQYFQLISIKLFESILKQIFNEILRWTASVNFEKMPHSFILSLLMKMKIIWVFEFEFFVVFFLLDLSSLVQVKVR